MPATNDNAAHRVQDKPLILQLHFTHHLYLMSESIERKREQASTHKDLHLVLTQFTPQPFLQTLPRITC